MFNDVWAGREADFGRAISEENLDEAHRLWVNAVEFFLWRLAGNGGDLPEGPRRGTIMPRITTKMTNQLAEFTPKVFGVVGIRLSRLVGRARDLKARLGRWTSKINRARAQADGNEGAAEASQDKYEVQTDELWEKGPSSDADHRAALVTRAAIARDARSLCSPELASEMCSQSPYASVKIVEQAAEEA